MVDIIIPFYNNSFEQINTALLTVIKQTIFKSTMIYIVNDASSNAVALDEVKKKYPYDNIIYLTNKKNSGPGVSRNQGIIKGSYDFIYFLDADDYIPEEDSLKKLYDTAIKYNADVVIGEVYNLNEPGKINIGNEEMPEGFVDDFYTGVSFQGNLYRRSFLEQNHILFPASYFCEENNFTAQVRFYNAILYHIKKKTYGRTLNENSITYLDNNISDKYRVFLDLNTTIHSLLDIVKYHKNQEDFINAFTNTIQNLNFPNNVFRNCYYSGLPLILILYYYGKIIYNIGEKYNLNNIDCWTKDSGIGAKLYGYYSNNIQSIDYCGKMYNFSEIKNLMMKIDKELKTVKKDYNLSINCPWNELELFGEYIDK